MASRDLTVDEIMAILPATPGRIAALTDGLPAALLRAAPEPDAWSINDVLAHLRACHDVLGGNMSRILLEESPSWKAMNPRTWMTKTDYPEWDFAAAFAVFRQQRVELLALLEPLGRDAWTRSARVTGLVGGAADRSVRYYGSWLASHERGHMAHIARIARAVTA